MVSQSLLPKRLVTDGDPVELYPVPPEEDFEQLEFYRAEDLERIALALIEEYPDKFHHLTEAAVNYYWKRKGGESGGVPTFGKCVRPTGLLLHVTQVNYIIWAAADNCRQAKYTRFSTEALMFHELRHTKLGETAKLEVQGHEFEGFVDEFEIYGAWRPVMKRIVEVSHDLPFED